MVEVLEGLRGTFVRFHGRGSRGGAGGSVIGFAKGGFRVYHTMSFWV